MAQASLQNLLAMHKSMNDALKHLETEIFSNLPTWQEKAMHGFEAKAIFQVRDEENLSVTEAKRKVDIFLASIR